MRPLTENAHDIVSVRDLFLDSSVPGFQRSSLSKEDFPRVLVEDIDDFFDTLNLLHRDHLQQPSAESWGTELLEDREHHAVN